MPTKVCITKTNAGDIYDVIESKDLSGNQTPSQPWKLYQETAVENESLNCYKDNIFAKCHPKVEPGTLSFRSCIEITQ
jgi:hypothetical protein